VIRAFIAADLDTRVIEKICAAVDALKPRIPAIRWLPKANLHLTIKFLGDVEEAQIAPIGTALRDELKLFPVCTISAKGLGVFPDLRRPKILWVGLAGNRLAELATKVESSLQPLGFAPEKRSFTPHLTIGRWRQADRPPKTLGQEIEDWRNFEFGACAVHEISLFQSVLKPEGATYYPLATVPLGTAHVGE
jgi:RNA 2',3'-cyclic 3'-phosphodiesterase